jgi:N-methylhydantoinase A/oxoprolinase/acetone carboxylase beta subunit
LGHGLDADAYIAQNDGTLMGLEYVRQYPVLTIGSGPTNSMRGAAYLTGFRDALVLDVGGTSTDIGILSAGFPRESATAVDIGGVRTNFRMPDLVSIAIGGGTVVHVSAGSFVVGPESIGYRLTKESVAFGGETLTLTDAAVGTGRSRGIGDPSRVKRFTDLLGAVIAHTDAVLADAVDRAKSSRSDLPGIAVGGGSILIPENVAGVKEIHRPDHYDVANAIGAAISSVSGEVDRVYKLGVNGRESALREAIEAAKDEAVRAGAAPDRVEVVEIQELPLAYLTDPVARIRVKAAGPLAGR